jgi:predicted NBD/HSP70 family sugar kinase
VVASLCNALNPRAVVVGGELAGTALVDGLREAIEHHALPAAAEAVTVTVGALGDRAAVLGALAAVIGDAERLRSTGLVAV